mgnify:CR=1 FL=1
MIEPDNVVGAEKYNFGEIEIENKENGWQKNIGYVPQSVFLTDDTVLNNIAFGVNDKEINIDSVNRSIKEAQLEETVQNFPNGLSTPVGERGAKLSGGEIQRIGDHCNPAVANLIKTVDFNSSQSTSVKQG